MPDSSALVVSPPSALSFGDPSRFDHLHRVATMFSKSQLVPVIFQKNVENVIIAMEMAERMGCSALMVMQNLNIIHGKPSFGASFMIAIVNACGRFSPLRFTMVGTEGSDDWGCFAQAKAKVDGADCKGVTITMELAKAEGWVQKAGSKWKTMPELMFQYRAATWWCRTFAPELLMGFPTQDEVIDITGTTPPPPEPTPRKINKGVAGMKNVSPPPEDPPHVQEDMLGQDAMTPPAPDPNPPAPEDLEKVERLPVRVEIADVVEKMAKKAGGIVGPVCTVTLAGEYVGPAFYDGSISALPGKGTVIDAFLNDRDLKGVKVKIIESFTPVG